MTAPMQGSPVSVNPATPSDHPENAHEQQNVIAEIDLDNGQATTEQGGTAATDLKLASEQVAMQGLHGYQVTAHAAAATARKGVALPPLRLSNGAIVHLKQASESICPRNPLEADLLWQDSCRGVSRLHRGSAPNQSSLCCATCGAICFR